VVSIVKKPIFKNVVFQVRVVFYENQMGVNVIIENNQ
jgi:hypothetical protein